MRRSYIIGACLALAVAFTSSGGGRQQGRGSLCLVRVADGFRMLVQVAAAPGSPGSLFVVEKGGVVRVVKAGKVSAQPFLDISGLVATGEEQGLLGLAFAPDYATSHRFVIDYTDRSGDTRVVRYRSNGTRALPGSATELLFVAPAVREPQRRQCRVRPGRAALRRDGRRRLRRRPREPGSEPELAPRQDPSPRPGSPWGRSR